jgi:Homoserine dehydrogenase
MRKVKIAVLGCGNVGKHLVKNIFELKDIIRSRYGLDLEIVKILVRDKKKQRTVNGFKIPQELLTSHFSDIIKAEPDIVVELIGDIDSARTFIKESLKSGKKVVTANKFLLSIDDEIFSDPNVLFDASCWGRNTCNKNHTKCCAGRNNGNCRNTEWNNQLYFIFYGVRS